MAVRACYPGSFDPVTYGHLDVIRRAAGLFEGLVVAVGANASKSPTFTPEERCEMIEAELADLRGSVEVTTFGGLVVDFCRSRGLDVLVRGLRTFTDFESERQMAVTNRRFAPAIETVFLLPSEELAHISSRLIREIVQAGGPVDAFVPPRVAAALAQRLGPPRPGGHP